MSDAQKAVDQKNGLFHQMKELVDSAESRGSWSGEDEAKFTELNKAYEAREAVSALETREQAVKASIASAAINFDAASADNESDILRKMALGEIRSHMFESRVLAPTNQSNTSSTTPIPTSFFNQIVTLARLVNPLLDLATVINTTSGEPLQLPSQSSFSVATIKAAGSSITASDPGFNIFTTLNSYKYSFITQVANELLKDTSVDLIGYLAGQAGNAFGYALGQDFILGTGGGTAPTGILTSAATGVVGSASTTAVSGPSTVGGFTADNIFDLIYSVDGALRQLPTFGILANASSIGAMRKLKDGYGRFIFEPAQVQGKRDLVGGVTVYETPAMPSIGSGSASLAAGDLKAYYVRNVNGLQVDRSDDYAFGNDLATFRYLWRADGSLLEKTHIKLFKGGTA
jgi:HK97 family phage major capsid protein